MEKFRKILIAGALGDALGYEVEFDDWEKITKTYGKKGIVIENYSKYPWIISDDTQMTLFCLQQLLPYINESKKLNTFNSYKEFVHHIVLDIYIGYQDWMRTQSNASNYKTELGAYLALQKRQAPGVTCLTALSKNIVGSIENPINDSKGCGGIMRVAPISFLPYPTEIIYDLGARQAAITHGHPLGYLSSGFFAGLIKELLNGNTWDEAYEKNKLITKKYNRGHELLDYLEKVDYYLAQPEILENEELANVIGQGWVGEEALGVAIYCVQKEKDFKRAVELGVNHQGDSDSTGSLVAQLFVAQYDLPEEFINFHLKTDIKKPFEFILNQIS
jgi:ADP-ribosyl-[dinitrogen reductase] hydrolase